MPSEGRGLAPDGWTQCVVKGPDGRCGFVAFEGHDMCPEHEAEAAAKGRVSSHGTQRDAEPPYVRHRHAKHRVCEEKDCDVGLPPWEQHEMVVCSRHMACTALSQGHG